MIADLGKKVYTYMMAQTNIQSTPLRGALREVPIESPIARIQTRMLKLKRTILTASDELDDNDLAASQTMAEMRTEEAREEAFDKWLTGLIKRREIEHEREIIEANLLAMEDALTKTGNRRYFDDQIAKETSRVDRSRYAKAAGETYQSISIGVIALDIDFFKKINDTLGHAFGDIALKEFVAIVKHMLRAYDTFARVGGEEFIILMEATKEDTEAKAERIRSEVEQELKKRLLTHCVTETERQAVKELAGTVSIGITNYSTEDKENTKEALMKQVDLALYHSKETGRNKVTRFKNNIKIYQ